MGRNQPTIKDVAKKAGVSVATVSRVMNNKGYLSEEVKYKVKQAMDDLGYIPNQIARSFFKKKTDVIGVIVPTIQNPYFSELVYYIEKYSAQKGLKILLCNSLNDPDIEKKYVTMLLENQVDGMIVGTHNDELKEYSTPNVPVIAIERFLNHQKIPTICCANYEGGKLATEFLLSKNCQNLICFAGESKRNYPANDRRKAYEDVLKSQRKEVKFVDVSSFDREMDDIIYATLQENPQIQGVFATDDIIAISVKRQFDKLGKIMNKDYYLVGFDGTEMVQTIYPDLITIKQPIFEMAKFSVDHLSSLIRGEKVPNLTELPVEIVANDM